VGSLLAGLGLGGLAIALAAKDTIANFFGSIMIFIDKPFQIGDWVVIGSTEGIIEEVGFRTTRVRTFYNSLVTVPNAKVVDTAVDNYGARRYRRYHTTLSLTYDTPPEKLQAFLEAVRALIAGMPHMRKDYYLVEFKDFGESSLEVMLYCFMVVNDWSEEMRTRTQLNLEILRLGRELGVSFAFPTRTLHLETLAQLGESRPSHSGPREREELVALIDSMGPYGAGAQVKALSRGYDNSPDWDRVLRSRARSGDQP
jgi:MscS family membrane protein